MTSRTAAFVVAFVWMTATCAACDSCGSASSASSGGGGTGAPGVDVDSADAEVGVSRVAVDGAVPCTGSAIDLAAVVGDPTCAITSGIAKSTRAAFEARDGGKQALKQEAVRLEDGRVELRLVNRGSLPAMLPLSWHPKIPAFIVLADSVKEKTLYELDAPALGVDLDGGPATARFARVVIAPGGHAYARITIEPKVMRRAGKPAAADARAEAGAGAMPERLTPGRWMLHLGQLVTDVDTGEPAMLPWDVEGGAAPIEAGH